MAPKICWILLWTSHDNSSIQQSRLFVCLFVSKRLNASSKFFRRILSTILVLSQLNGVTRCCDRVTPNRCWNIAGIYKYDYEYTVSFSPRSIDCDEQGQQLLVMSQRHRSVINRRRWRLLLRTARVIGDAECLAIADKWPASLLCRCFFATITKSWPQKIWLYLRTRDLFAIVGFLAGIHW